jgi:hypothetical protein
MLKTDPHMLKGHDNYRLVSQVSVSGIRWKRSICVALRHFKLTLMMQDIINIPTDTLTASGINKTYTFCWQRQSINLKYSELSRTFWGMT